MADALNELEQEFAGIRLQERDALMRGLGTGGEVLRQSIFEPQMDVSSFFERRSNPEISALLQLLGQQEAANLALQVAQLSGQNTGGGLVGQMNQQQLLQLLGYA